MELKKAFYSPTELAGLLDLSSDTIVNYIKDNKVFAIKLSERTYRIPRREVARVLGEPLVPSRVTETGHGGAEAAERVRRRIRQEKRERVAR